MASTPSPVPSSLPSPPPPPSPPPETRFVNAMRLNLRNWFWVAAWVISALILTPWLWKKLERFDTGPDYRIPYPLSRDYWLYERRLQHQAPTNFVVLGDSVIWGEYVTRSGTLTHFMDRESGVPGSFVNAGVNGLFPLALEGLIRHYGAPLRRRPVLLHCNLLWLTSPKADLSTTKEERFNHAELVPQFRPRIPSYKASIDHRLATIVGRNFPVAQWVNHLQMAYFDQKNLMSWTLAEDASDPPRYPNVYRNPLSQITLTVMPEPPVDPERGPASPRHKPWSNTGQGSTRFEWVDLEQSLQWGAFQRLVKLLESRGNRLLVVLGPFNEQIMAEENRPGFQRLNQGVQQWLQSQRVPYVAPAPLPSLMYADASHPLTEGYERLAQELWRDATFQAWRNGPR